LSDAEWTVIEAAHGRFNRPIADRGYDSNAIRDAYRARNLVERLWCRLKDWRRIANDTTSSPATTSRAAC